MRRQYGEYGHTMGKLELSFSDVGDDFHTYGDMWWLQMSISSCREGQSVQRGG